MSKALKKIEEGELEAVRESVVAQVAAEIGDVVAAVLKKARTGDVAAARLLFEVSGLVRRSVSVNQQNVQVNLTPQERKLLEDDFRDRPVINITPQK